MGTNDLFISVSICVFWLSIFVNGEITTGQGYNPHIGTHTYMHIHTRTRTPHTTPHIRTHTHAHARARTHTHAHTHTRAHTHTHTHHTHTHTTHTHTDRQTYRHTCTCTCTLVKYLHKVSILPYIFSKYVNNTNIESYIIYASYSRWY